jgi:asparagine synthase (glutamine-hydrolysing)
MGRVFTGHQDGVTAFSNRPGLVASVLGLAVTPDPDGWASFAACGFFGGSSSPFQGVRQLGPGVRVTGRRRDGGGWHLAVETRHCVDDVISSGIAARSQGLHAALDLAADGFTTTAASVARLYGDQITLGLSGGKDSRLIAAALIHGGRLPILHTNEDTVAEGDTARALVAILRDKRGLRPEHRLARVATRSVVDDLGLRERIRRLQGLYDYQFPSTYTVRSPGPPTLPVEPRPVSFSGAGGEIVAGYWYPKENVDPLVRSDAEAAIVERLLSSGSASAVPPPISARVRAVVAPLVDRGESLGLRGLELMDYVYLVDRVRRWYTSAYFVGMVTPFLAPGVVAASFAVSPQHKSHRSIHTGLLERFVPEWLDVPYVGKTTGASTAVRVWDGDGLQAIHGLLDTVHGDLTHLMRRDLVSAALVTCANGDGTAKLEKRLQQFAYLAVASQTLEPDGVRPATSSYADFAHATARSPSGRRPRLSSVASRLRFIRGSRLGRSLWDAARASRARRRGGGGLAGAEKVDGGTVDGGPAGGGLS